MIATVSISCGLSCLKKKLITQSISKLKVVTLWTTLNDCNAIYSSRSSFIFLQSEK
jgi:hypothetical protein